MKHVLSSITLALCLLLTTMPVLATYGFAEGQLLITEDGTTPTADVLVGGSIVETDAGTIGWEGFALMTDGWWETYLGVTYTPVPQLTLALQAGVQGLGGDVSERFALSTIVNHDWFNFVGVVEFDTTGLDGLWYKLVATGKATSWLKLGVEWRRFVGLGPHVSLTISKTPISLWLTWSPIEPEGLGGSYFTPERMMLGVQVGF